MNSSVTTKEKIVHRILTSYREVSICELKEAIYPGYRDMSERQQKCLHQNTTKLVSRVRRNFGAKIFYSVADRKYHCI